MSIIFFRPHNDNLLSASSSPTLYPDLSPNATLSIPNNIASSAFSQCPGPSKAFSDISDHVTSSAILPTLPPCESLIDPFFVWGSTDSSSIFLSITAAFEEVVHWKGNLFSVPRGNCGCSFVKELARLFSAYAEASGLEAIAMKAVTVLCVLLLQRPHPRSKYHEHQSCLKRRLALWVDGDISSLLFEGRSLQNRLTSVVSNKPRNLIRSFSNLMLLGKVRDALQLINGDAVGGALSLYDFIPPDPNSPNSTPLTVLDVLRYNTHPLSRPWRRPWWIVLQRLHTFIQ